MSKQESIKAKIREMPKWIFPWRRSGSFNVSSWVAMMLTAGVFAFFFTVVRVRIAPVEPWAVSHATMLVATDEGEGRALALRAMEDGPFPSRFAPDAWEGHEALEQSLWASVRTSFVPYEPTLKSFPHARETSLPVAARGEPVLPRRHLGPVDAPAPVRVVSVPVIKPISGILAAEIPSVMPPLDAAVGDKYAGDAWRFLLRVDATGQVLDCISMAGGDESGPSPVERWLSRIRFKIEPNHAPRWMAVGVEFANQPLNDGTDSH